MDLFAPLTFDMLAATFLTCLVVRELMIVALPDSVAGPGGWLIDTGRED